MLSLIQVDEAHKKFNHCGRTKLYELLKSKYYNITQHWVTDYLSKCTVCQVHSSFVVSTLTLTQTHTALAPPKVVQPIISLLPGERYQLDLMNVSAYKEDNDQYQYIMTLIDHFSGYTWLRAL